MSRSKITTAGRRSSRRGGVNLARMRRPPTHPGEILDKEFLEPLGRGAQTAAAARMGMSLNRLNEILIGKRGVSAESAVLIGALTGTDPRMWLGMQADFDLWHAMRAVDVAKIKPLKGD